MADKLNWDPKLTKWGVDKVLKSSPKWKLVAAYPLDETKMGGASVIQVATLGATGKRITGVKCYSDWEGRNPKDEPPGPRETESYSGEKYGKCQFPMTGVIKLDKDGNLASRGNHFCWVEDRSKSDEVNGMGLVNGRPTSFEVVFQLQEAPKPPVKPPVKK